MLVRRLAQVVTALAVLAAPLAAVPAAHAADGTLAGTVTGVSGVLPDIEVDVYQFDDPHDRWVVVVSTDTDARGDYAISLPTGDYRVGFHDRAGAYVKEFWVDALEVDGANTVHLTGDGADVDAELAPSAHLTGTVTGPDGAGVGDVRVEATRVYGHFGRYAQTDHTVVFRTSADGTYDVGGLPAGTYRLGFDDGPDVDAPSAYATEWYADQPLVHTATDVVLATGETRGGIDAVLARDAQVSGRVTDATGAPIHGAFASVYLRVDREWWPIAYKAVATRADGTYVLDGLPAGTYRVHFLAVIDNVDVRETWNDQDRFDDGQDIVLKAGDAFAGVDAQLIAPPAPPPTPTPAPVVTTTAALTAILADLDLKGAAKVGRKVRVTGLDASFRTSVSYRLRWYAGGRRIAGATKPRLRITAPMKGRKISVTVTAKASGAEVSKKLVAGRAR